DFEAIKPGLLTLENVMALESLEPFGNENMPTVICMKRATLQSISGVGGGKHTRVRLVKSGESFDGIFFSRTMEELSLMPGDLVDAAFEVQTNRFRGRQSVQLLLQDLRIHTE
ncbi:MAG: single-stranded-DNA-specific exonuclease RecJ, partial [Oscillospiraceae bacterium]|nr:single-stranded-DNA-specific exonuclease RecJ [Oscillospiraceae bacterium]